MSLDIEEVVRPGDKIASVPYVSGDEADKTYVSKVFDFTDDGNIEVLMPMEGTKIVLLPVGAEFDATFYAKKGMYGSRRTICLSCLLFRLRTLKSCRGESSTDLTA